MLTVRDIRFSFGKEILSGIDLDLGKGKILGLVGASGTGKSTLLKIIAGLLDADAGTVLLDGKRVYGPAYKLIPGHPDVQLVNQDFALDPYYTVRENLQLKAQYLPEATCRALVDELLELLELKQLSDQKAHLLSGGEQQRLALGRALATEPKVLLLDEPFAHLDAHLKSRISNYLVALKEVRDTAFILVTHDGQEVLSLADEIAFFEAGKIKRTAPPEVFYNHPVNAYEGFFFGELNVIHPDNEPVLFRPNAYHIVPEDAENGLEVEFIRAAFAGAYYQNYFSFNKKEYIVLYHSQKLEHVTKIVVDQKIQGA
jgi:ABC-type Fe3+/spermidine/putrescine transport system ATPase subunit